MFYNVSNGKIRIVFNYELKAISHINNTRKVKDMYHIITSLVYPINFSSECFLKHDIVTSNIIVRDVEMKNERS